MEQAGGLAATARVPMVLVLAVALMVTACTHASGQSTTAEAAAPPGSFHLTDDQLRSLEFERVRDLPFHSQLVVDGKIAYDGDALTPVFSPFSGRITELVAPLGAAVHRGAPLFRLQAAEFAQDASDLLTAQTQVRLNDILEQRKHAQYLSHGASLQDWQQAQSELMQSRATLAAARNRLRILGESDAQIDALVAEGANVRAEATAVAPITGIVVDRQVGPGQYVQAGSSTPVYTVADLSRLWLVAEVPEVDASAVRLGEDVTAEVVGLPDHPYHARLSYVGAAVDAASRRLAVHANLDNQGGHLRPEMFATLTIITSGATAAPAVPKEAVIYQGMQARVWVLQDAQDAALRLVHLGRELNGYIEVLGGLKAGEQVITRGALFIDRAASGG